MSADLIETKTALPRANHWALVFPFITEILSKISPIVEQELLSTGMSSIRRHVEDEKKGIKSFLYSLKSKSSFVPCFRNPRNQFHNMMSFGWSCGRSRALLILYVYVRIHEGYRFDKLIIVSKVKHPSSCMNMIANGLNFRLPQGTFIIQSGSASLISFYCGE